MITRTARSGPERDTPNEFSNSYRCFALSLSLGSTGSSFQFSFFRSVFSFPSFVTVHRGGGGGGGRTQRCTRQLRRHCDCLQCCKMLQRRSLYTTSSKVVGPARRAIATRRAVTTRSSALGPLRNRFLRGATTA